MSSNYKLNVKRDVDVDGPGNYLLNLPRGFRFSDETVHVRSYNDMREIRLAVKTEVVLCDCEDCKKVIAR